MVEQVVDQAGRVSVALAVRGQVAPDGEIGRAVSGGAQQAGTGTPYHNVYLFKFTFRDGLITHIAEYANPVTFAKLAGIPLG